MRIHFTPLHLSFTVSMMRALSNDSRVPLLLVTKVMLASEEKQHRRRCRPVHVWVQTRRRSKCPLGSSCPRGLGKRPIRSHFLNTTDTDTLRLQGNALTPLPVPAPASGFLRLHATRALPLCPPPLCQDEMKNALCLLTTVPMALPQGPQPRWDMDCRLQATATLPSKQLPVTE